MAKEYKIETYFKAIFIVDQYLSKLAQQGRCPPDLIHLGTVSILMAAKLEQPISPSFNRMIKLLPAKNQKETSKQDLIDLESDIVRVLDWNFYSSGPLPFLERFARLLDID